MGKPLEKVAAFIVDRRKGFYLIYILLAIFSVFSTNWVKVDNNLTDYLDEASETRRGLTLMDEEFTTYATAEVMVDNIAYADSEKLRTELEKIDGVKEIAFDSTDAHYNDAAALFSVTFSAEADDPICEKALSQIEKRLSDYDLYVSAELGDTKAKTTAAEMRIVMVIACVIILSVLTLTSRTYMEIPVLVITFGMSALLNKGTNFMFGTISFISNSISVVLQLALAIDYAIILCHRYTEERENLGARAAVVQALCKAIPEISGSCLTTLSGLGAMSFMHFKLGLDMSMVMIKAIIISIITVFTLMPGLLLSFSPLIDKTHHRSFVPKITAWNEMVVKLRYIVPIFFVAAVIGCFLLSKACPYVYSYTNLSTINKNEAQIAQEMINDTFSSENVLAVLIPSGDYEKEQALAEELENFQQVDSVTSLAAVEAKDGYSVGDKLSPREFAELTDIDIELVRLVYTAYASREENYGRIIGGIDDYRIALVDLFDFVYEVMEEGYVTLDDETADALEELNEKLADGKLQLESDDHSRLVLNLNLPEESPETFEFLETVRSTAEKYYSDVTLAGNSTNDFDLSSTFGQDNTLISILSILFVMLVLFFTFQSAGIPIILILVIQGSVWINFSFPTLMDRPLFFMSYLIVSSIQMGANIDYAIVITNRYTELRREMSKLDAIKQSLDLAFPTIFTSGSILTAAGAAIGLLSSEPAISSIGVCLSRGTLISIALVMGVLPQLLVLGDFIIEKTSFSIKNIKRSGAGALAAVLAVGMIPAVRAESDAVIISSREELIAFSKNCTLDTWSIGKTVELTADIDMEDVSFSPIPTFGGVFNGNGHKITNLSISKSGSDIGLFRYIQEGGRVCDLNVSGKVTPGGSMSRVGGIAGDNFGVIQGCAFNGIVEGENKIGGIAGNNAGQILSCTASGSVSGQNFTGGIAGENDGYISGCENQAAVNTSPEEKKRSLTDIDTDAGALVENIITDREENEEESVLGHTDTGGVAGYNTGIIQGCKNAADIGYQHIGYNVGGIAGRQSGYILGCGNSRTIRGRKDIGGIVGQAEPYITLTISETTLDEVKNQLDSLNSMINGLISDTKDLGSEAGRRLDEIKRYADSARTDANTLADSAQKIVDDNIAEINALSASLSNTVNKLADTSGGLVNGVEYIESAMTNFSSAIDAADLTAPDISGDIDEAALARDELRSINIYSEEVSSNIDGIGNALDELRSIMDDSGEFNGIKSALDSIVSAEKALNSARVDARKALRYLNNGINVNNETQERQFLSDLSAAVKAAATAKQSIKASLDSIEAIISSHPGSFQDLLGNAENILSLIRTVNQGLVQNAAALDIISNSLDELILNTSLDFSDFSRAGIRIADAFDDLDLGMSAVSRGVKEFRSALENGIDTVWGANGLLDALDKLDAAVDSTRSTLGSIGDEASTKLNSGLDRLDSAADSMRTKIENFADEARPKLSSARELLSSGLKSLSYASDDIGNTFDDVSNIVSDFISESEPQFIAPGEDFRSAGEGLLDSFSGIANGISGLRSTVSDSSELDELNMINDQLNVVMELAAGELDSLNGGSDSERFVDASDEDIENSKQGKVADCNNSGSVEGDRNVGGIAGALAIEYARDPEDEIEKPDALNFTYTTKAILAHCLNEGAITGKKDCVGGIVGLADIGTVYQCESYAPTESTSGSYVGGVAGRASGNLRLCYSKADVTGKDYIGGIAGKGERLSACVSLSAVTGEECVGAVMGDCDNRSDSAGNLFIDRGIGGIDGISYSGCAEPADYDTLANMAGIPVRLISFSVTFIADEKTVEVQNIKYAEDTGRIVFPEAPEKEGCFGRWPKIEEDTVTSDIKLVCEYQPYITVISSTEKSGELPVALAEGNFTDEAALHATATGENIYDIELSSAGSGPATIRLLKPSGKALAGTVAVQLKTESGWRRLDSKERGKYVVFEIPDPAATVRLVNEGMSILLPILILLLALICLAVLFIIYRKRKAKGKAPTSSKAQ